MSKEKIVIPHFQLTNQSEQFKLYFPPKRIWWYIFTYLDLIHLEKVSLVCKAFNIIAKDDELWKIIYKKYKPFSQFVDSMQKLNLKKKIEFDFSMMWMKKVKTFVLQKYGSKRPICCICEQQFVVSFDLGGEFKNDRYHCRDVGKSK